MSPVIVADASCLIGLQNCGKLEILPKLYSDILIPPAVAREFGDVVSFARVMSPTDKHVVQTLCLLLGAGESEAIALALELQTAIILDDKKARTVAEGMGLSPIGTVGILLKAKLTNLLPSLTDAIDALERGGFYVSSALKSEALRLGGE